MNAKMKSNSIKSGEMKADIWVADDDSSMLWVIEKALSKQGYTVTTFTDGEQLLAALVHSRPNLVVSDIRMPTSGGFDLLEKVNQNQAQLPVIIITAFGDLESAVEAYKLGAYEYLTKPFDIDELLGLVTRALDTANTRVDGGSINKAGDKPLLGESAPMQEVFRIIGRIAHSNIGVLIRGESGTGKELVAKAIHQNSRRRNQPMISINTAAIPSELLESELFGHEKGAFTGAHNRHVGRFEQADQATLFLDEIGDMPLALQTRLLRVLSEGRFYRLGGRQEIAVDVRIIAATNQHLETLVEKGQFRDDLFHRLNVFSLAVPCLSERVEDIPILVTHFLHQSAHENAGKLKRLGDEVMVALQQYHWPGNIRELENVIQQLSILCAGSQIMLADLPNKIKNGHRNGVHPQDDISWQDNLAEEATRRLRSGETGIAQSLGNEVEQVLINVAMEHAADGKQKAATLLGWSRNTLARKIKIFSSPATKRF